MPVPETRFAMKTHPFHLASFAVVSIMASPCPSVVAQTDNAMNPERPAIKFQVLQSRKIDLGNHSLIINRVVPPVLPELPPAPAPRSAEQIAAARAAAALRRPAKKRVNLFLSATVYDRKVTEIRWSGGSHEHRVFSNIDFNLFGGACDLETADTIYSLMLAVGNETAEQVERFNRHAAEHGLPTRLRKQIPSLETFSQTRSEYVVAEDETHATPSGEELKALDALHVFYDANRQQLADEYAKREAARIAREQWLKEHPPKPKDTVINYWIGPLPPRSDGTTSGGQP